MSAPTQTATCPSWCEAPHDEDHYFHFQQGVDFKTRDGSTFDVSADFNDHTAAGVVHIGTYPIDALTARAIALELLDAAILVEQTAKENAR